MPSSRACQMPQERPVLIQYCENCRLVGHIERCAITPSCFSLAEKLGQGVLRYSCRLSSLVKNRRGHCDEAVQQADCDFGLQLGLHGEPQALIVRGQQRATSSTLPARHLKRNDAYVCNVREQLAEDIAQLVSMPNADRSSPLADFRIYPKAFDFAVHMISDCARPGGLFATTGEWPTSSSQSPTYNGCTLAIGPGSLIWSLGRQTRVLPESQPGHVGSESCVARRR